MKKANTAVIARLEPGGPRGQLRTVGIGSGHARCNDYLSVGNVNVGLRVVDNQNTVTTRYFHTDHLGSVAVITNEGGAVVERLSYDAWGKRRFPNGTDDPTGSIISQTSRGFSGHEMLGDVGLVHMNGRVYDPLVGRMISADPTVPDPMNAQAWNRYSYVGNDPLAFTDPSGFSWLSSFFHSVANFFTHNPIVRAIAQIVITAALVAIIAIPVIGPVIAAAAGAAIVTGLSGGNLGQMLRAGAIAGATAFAFNVVGSATNAVAGQGFDLSAEHITPQIGSPEYVFNVAGHAAVGCLSSVASGGSCKSGALAGGVSAAATPLVNQAFPNAKTNTGDFVGGAAASGIVGGLASMAGGGKFENGAITGAFGYMYNNQAGRIAGGIVGGIIGAALTGPEDVPLTWMGFHLGSALGDWLTGPDTPEGGSQIDRSVFRSEREAYWKGEAQSNTSEYSSENLARMESGKAPIGADGYPMELHHVDGSPDGGLQPTTRTDHRLGDNYLSNHPWLNR